MILQASRELWGDAVGRDREKRTFFLGVEEPEKVKRGGSRVQNNKSKWNKNSTWKSQHDLLSFFPQCSNKRWKQQHNAMCLVCETAQHCLWESGVCMISEEPKLRQRLSLTALLSVVKIERSWVTQVDSILAWVSSTILNGVSPSSLGFWSLVLQGCTSDQNHEVTKYCRALYWLENDFLLQ